MMLNRRQHPPNHGLGRERIYSCSVVCDAPHAAEKAMNWTRAAIRDDFRPKISLIFVHITRNPTNSWSEMFLSAMGASYLYMSEDTP